ncbi:hypothetical protein [Mycolicibacterium mageritense]|uniref:hypothetical protein n=1 Tax=Mycolicibacterium mageritense TaxID=53462 RepID=UPI0011D6153C|nr:hypothetical protein [Mycolicibacterium mageritense]TXI53503.1 MAG: hypothetical protein E6Q55_35045 [Mycolicibacterium mageritense]
MSTPRTTYTVDHDPNINDAHRDALRRRQCVSAACTDCGQTFPDDDYAYHFHTRTELIAAIGETDWQLDNTGPRCTNCTPDRRPQPSELGDITPETFDWLSEACCFTIHCTRCLRTLESDYGEAHFASTRAATEAALAARWHVSAHRTWCARCTAALITTTATTTSRRPR